MRHFRWRYGDLSRGRFQCLVAHGKYDCSFQYHEYLGIRMTMKPGAHARQRISPEEGHRYFP